MTIGYTTNLIRMRQVLRFLQASRAYEQMTRRRGLGRSCGIIGGALA